MRNIIAYTDGGSRGNPGDSAIGVYMLVGKKIFQHKRYIGIATNNVAEYEALLLAVDVAVSAKAECLFVYADSMLVVQQMKGAWQIKDEKLRVIYDKIIKLLSKLKEFHIEYIPREKNKEADRLVNEALDEKQGKK